MKDMRLIKPGAGKRIRTIEGVVIPEEGMRVVWGSYYDRLIRDGEIKILSDKKKKPRKKKIKMEESTKYMKPISENSGGEEGEK